MLIVVFFVSCATTYLLSRVAKPLGLIAHPGEHRHHDRSTPLVGGLAIFIGLLFGCVLIDRSFVELLPSLTLMCAVGALDDRFKLPSLLRFVFQGIAAWLMISLTGVQLVNLGALFGQENVLLGRWSVPLTIFATMGVINAVNMSDGMDGLAGSLVIIVLLALLLISGYEQGLILIAIASVAGFLVWNLRLFRMRAYVFMGDAGSTLLGLLIAYLLIGASQNSNAMFAPVTALWFLALPLFDAVAVLLLRPLRGFSPFKADRIHYHHLLHYAGVGVNQTLLLVLAVQCALIGLGIWMMESGVTHQLQFSAFLFCFALYFLSLTWVTKRE